MDVLLNPPSKQAQTISIHDDDPYSKMGGQPFYAKEDGGKQVDTPKSLQKTNSSSVFPKLMNKNQVKGDISSLKDQMAYLKMRKE